MRNIYSEQNIRKLIGFTFLVFKKTLGGEKCHKNLEN